eukprot:c21708_g1_i1 orf=17-1750(-)
MWLRVLNINGAWLFFSPFGTRLQMAVRLRSTAPESSQMKSHEEDAAVALRDYLLTRRSELQRGEVCGLVESSPMFVRRLTTLVKQEQLGGPGQARMGGSFKMRVKSYLEDKGCNLLEPCLESLGFGEERLRRYLRKLSTVPNGERNLICIVRRFERVGISRISLGRLTEIESRILQYTDAELYDGLCALKEFGVPGQLMASVIMKYPLILRSEVLAKIRTWLSLLSRFPSKEDIARKTFLLSPFRLGTFQKVEGYERLQYLRCLGLSEAEIDGILCRRPMILLSHIEKELKPNVLFLEDLGIPIDRIAKAIQKNPGLLVGDAQKTFKPKVEYFKSLGLDDHSIAGMVLKYPMLFSCSIENKLKPVVAELQTLGVSPDNLKKILAARPTLFGYKVGGDVSKLIKNLDTFKCKESMKALAFVKAFGKKSAHINWLKDFLVQQGLSQSDAQLVLEKAPRILSCHENDLILKIENLTKTLGMDVKSLVSVPQYLSTDFKKRILRRQRVLSYLQSRGLLTENVTLGRMVMISRNSFCDLYVKPYPECAELYKIWKNDYSNNEIQFVKFLKFPQDENGSYPLC